MTTISPWTIYLWAQADTFRETLPHIMAGCFLSGVMVAAITALIVFVAEKPEFAKWPKRILCLQAVIFLLASFLNLFIPSSKTIALMVVVPAIVNSEPIQKDLPEIYKIGIEALKEKLAGEKTGAVEKK